MARERALTATEESARGVRANSWPTIEPELLLDTILTVGVDADRNGAERRWSREKMEQTDELGAQNRVTFEFACV